MKGNAMDDAALRALWAEVGEVHKDPETLAPAFGVDVRVRPKRLFRAIFAVIKAIVAVKSGGAITDRTKNPGEGFGVVSEVVDACNTFLKVFYERVSELSYVVALYLGGNAGPVAIAELANNLPGYMGDLEGAYAANALPWYLRLTPERIKMAGERLRLKMLEGDLADMEAKGLVVRSGDTVEVYKSSISPTPGPRGDGGSAGERHLLGRG